MAPRPERAGSAFAAAALAVSAVTATAQPAGELESAMSVNAGYGHSDNVTRDAEDELSSSYQLVGFDFDLLSERERFTGGLAGDMELRRYSEDEVLGGGDDDETVGSVDGTASVDLVSDIFAWDFGANIGHARTDPFEVASPGNRERVQVLSTGPSFAVPLGTRTSLQIGGSLVERSYEDSASFDSELTQSSLAVYRALSRVTRVGIELSTSEVEFDAPVPGYEFESARLSYERDLASGRVALGLGSGEVTRAGTSSGSRPSMSFSWSRDVGTRSSLSIDASRELTDSGRVFSSGGIARLDTSGRRGRAASVGSVDDSRLENAVLDSEPMERTSADVRFAIDGRRTSITVSVGASEEDFEGTDALDNDGRHAEIGFSRELNPEWTGRLRIRAFQQDFAGAGTNDDLTSRVTASRVIGRRGSVEFVAEHDSRTGGLVPSDENVFLVTMRYGLVQ